MSKNIHEGISKADLLSALDATKEELQGHTLAKYVFTLEDNLFTSNYKFTSPWIQKRDREYKANVKSGGKFLEHIEKMLVVSYKWMTVIHKEFSDSSATEINQESLTYPVKALTDLYAALKFHVEYSRKLLLMVFALESDDPDSNQIGKISFPFSKAEVLTLESTFNTFCKISRVIETYSKRDISTILATIPDISASDDAAIARATYGIQKLEPMMHGVTDVGGIPNLIYYVRKFFASRQAASFKAAEAEAKSLDLRLLRMRRQAEGTEDPQLDKAIEYQTKRLAELNYRNHELSIKYGL